MPKLKFVTSGAGGRIPKGNKLKRQVEKLLSGKDAYDAVIALTDVYSAFLCYEVQHQSRSLKQFEG
jgi:hypothetical protein